MGYTTSENKCRNPNPDFVSRGRSRAGRSIPHARQAVPDWRIFHQAILNGLICSDIYGKRGFYTEKQVF
jgi:hypothetical protein